MDAAVSAALQHTAVRRDRLCSSRAAALIYIHPVFFYTIAVLWCLLRVLRFVKHEGLRFTFQQSV